MDDVASRTRPHGARPILPHHLATLVQQASYRHVQLLIMSPGQGAGGRGQGAGAHHVTRSGGRGQGTRGRVQGQGAAMHGQCSSTGCRVQGLVITHQARW